MFWRNFSEKNILERKGKEFDVKKFERENFEKN